MDPLQITLTVGAVAAAITGVTTLLVRAYKAVKRLDAAIGVDDKGNTAVDRLETTVAEIGRRVERVEYQLHPNGGGSLADKVTQVDRQVVELRAQTDIVLTLLGNLNDRRDGRAH